MLTTGLPPARSTISTATTGPIKRVIVAAVGTAALLMPALTVGLAAGARESVVTGLALIAVATGFAMLALLSVRRTNRPQRWAFGPAVAMALTGAAMAVVRPGDAVLTAAGWVWPPLLLALTVWMARESWRHLPARPGRGPRWLIVPALAALLLAGIGGAYESVALAGDHRTSAMPGHLYDVGGYRLHLDCTGSGSPTVVLLSGLGEMSPYWARIAPAVAAGTRVCAYDRAGQGWSDSSPHPADGTQTARDLHALLAAAHEDGPFVLAGHSSGGVYALTFAAHYPDQVAGVVLLDSSSPHQRELLPSFALTSAFMHRLLTVLPTLARLGFGHLAPPSTTLPSPAAGQVASFAGSPRGLANERDEQAALSTAMRQAQALTTLGDKPLVVLTTRDELTKTPGWGTAQDQLAALSSNSVHGVVDTTHAAVLDDPASAAAAARAITDVVRGVRTDTPLGGSVAR